MTPEELAKNELEKFISVRVVHEYNKKACHKR